MARSLSSASLSLLSSCIVIIIIIKGKSVTYIAARRGEVQPLLVYHRTVVILKGLDRVVELRYIQPGLVLGPVAVWNVWEDYRRSILMREKTGDCLSVTSNSDVKLLEMLPCQPAHTSWRWQGRKHVSLSWVTGGHFMMHVFMCISWPFTTLYNACVSADQPPHHHPDTDSWDPEPRSQPTHCRPRQLTELVSARITEHHVTQGPAHMLPFTTVMSLNYTAPCYMGPCTHATLYYVPIIMSTSCTDWSLYGNNALRCISWPFLTLANLYYHGCSFLSCHHALILLFMMDNLITRDS